MAEDEVSYLGRGLKESSSMSQDRGNFSEADQAVTGIVPFSDFIAAYQVFLRAKNRNQTELGELIQKFIQAYNDFPWRQTWNETAALNWIRRPLMETDIAQPFCFVHKTEGNIDGATLGLTAKASHIGFWLSPSENTFRQIEIAHQVNDARARSGWVDTQVTVIAEVFVAPPEYETEGDAEKLEDLIDKPPPKRNPRAHATVALELLRKVIAEQLAKGLHEYVGLTIRRKTEDVSKQARMYQIVKWLGGKDLAILGDLPTNHEYEQVIVGGDLRDAAAIFDTHGLSLDRYFLRRMREDKWKGMEYH